MIQALDLGYLTRLRPCALASLVAIEQKTVSLQYHRALKTMHGCTWLIKVE